MGRRSRALALALAVVAQCLVLVLAAGPAVEAEEYTPPGHIVARGLAEPSDVVRGPDGNIWFSDIGSRSIGSITAAGEVSIRYSEDATPSFFGARGLALGPDGLLWFTDASFDAVGKITPTGVIRYRGSGLHRPTEIVAGPDGNLWFVSGSSHTIGRVTPSGLISTFTGNGIADPLDITAGPDGNLWFTNFGSSSIGRITPSGVVSTFSGEAIGRPRGITAGADGNLWFTNLAAGTGDGSIGRITPSGAVSSFAATGFATPLDITVGSDGNVWFTNQASSSIGRVTPDGTLSRVTDPGIRSPTGIALGSDGNVWFASSGNASLGRVTPAGVAASFFGTGINRAEDLTVGPDGNLWFTNQGGSSIGRITPEGVVARFTAPGISGPHGIASGADGNLWFTNYAANSIGRITPSGDVTTFTDPGIHGPWAITAGPDGNLWFVNRNSDTLGRITPAGLISLFATPGITDPDGITAGPDGNVWFSNPASDSIGRITATGAVSTFTGPGIDGPSGITAGPDGNLWFINHFSIGRITPAGIVTTFSDEGIRGAVDIAAGPNGTVIFANYGTASSGGNVDGASIGQISATGQVSAHSYNGMKHPRALATGPDGNIWFTTTTNRIGILYGRWPGMPRGVAATAGHGSATVSWLPPASDDASPATGYFVTAGPSGKGCIWRVGPLSCTVTGLTPREATTFTVVATNGHGFGARSLPSEPVVPLDGLQLHALVPKRIIDSRPAPLQVGPYGTSWGPAQTRDVPVAGVGGVPAGAAAVVVNVTATGTTESGYLTIWPAGEARPMASSLNWAPGVTVPNMVTVKVGAGGRASVLNAVGRAHVIFDVVGYYDATSGSGYTPLDPARILDSRPAGPRVGPYGTPWSPNQVRDVSVTGMGGVAADAHAVVLNVTVTGTTGAGYLSIWPSGQPRPHASSLNWSPGQTVANAVTVMVGAGGKVSVFNATGSAHVIVDVVGSFTPGTGSRFFPLAPVRVQDSRVPGVGLYLTPWRAGTSRVVNLADWNEIPIDASAALLNVTATGTTASSYLTVSPTGQAPLASSLNWAAGQTIANAVPTKLGGNAAVTVTNALGDVHVIADVFGWYA